MVWYQELSDIQMSTVKQKKAWAEEITLSFDSVKSQALFTLAFQVVLLKVKQILEQLKRRKLDCKCANVRKPFPLPTQPLYLSAASMLLQLQSCICTISWSWWSWWGEGGEVPFPLWAGQEGALLLRIKCPNHSIQEEASQLTQLHSAWESHPRVRVKPLNNSKNFL